MKKKLTVIGVAVLLTMFCSLVLVPKTMALTPGQQKLLAKRAAQVDAYRKLAEMVKGLRITSDTYVRDFVAESDEVRTSFDTFLKGAKIVGMPRYYDDGTCEVDVELTIKQVVEALQRIYKQKRRWRTVYTIAYDQMVQYNKIKVIRATGTGVPREVPMAMDIPQPAQLRAQTMASPTTGIHGWENVTARGRLMAQRAAKVDAYRNLAETVKGLRISGNTYVRDFVAESDQIQTQLDTFLKGVQMDGPYIYLPDAIVECRVSVAVQTVVKELVKIREWYVQRYGRRWVHAHWSEINFENIIKVSPTKIIKASGNGTVPPKYMRQPMIMAPVPAPVPVASAPAWASEIVTAVGTGIPAEGMIGTEARLMAARAAELDAKRNLTEMVYGVYIDANTTVRDFAVLNDEVNTQVSTFLAGVSVGEPRYLSDGSVEVTVQAPLAVLWERIKRYRM
ncbi:MAG: hypothetical protein P9M03_05180 [Candidatus Theseobacter exili]|nr:hypothetical protein [Candidatus Theseobacter exili]